MTGARCETTLGGVGTYELLLGSWRIERTYLERGRHERGTFTGTVTVVPSPIGTPGTARYVEEGRFVLGAYHANAERRLEVRRRPDGAVSLGFEDGRPFVDCDLRSGDCRAVHPCGDDRYEISWHAVSRDELTERWRVLGPQKDYDAWAVLRRRSDEAGGPTSGDDAPGLAVPTRARSTRAAQPSGRQVAMMLLPDSTSTSEKPAAGSTRSTSCGV